MSERTDKLLTDGLAEGYGGLKKPEKIKRSYFRGKSNYYNSPEGGHYHDEWFADDNGGGQELTEIDGEKFTRLYGGGVIPVEELQKLGLTTKNVLSKLSVSINTLRNRTRLHTPSQLKFMDGLWLYTYSILKQSEEVPLTVGYESIEYKGREVFAHAHILSPIK